MLMKFVQVEGRQSGAQMILREDGQQGEGGGCSGRKQAKKVQQYMCALPTSLDVMYAIKPSTATPASAAMM